MDVKERFIYSIKSSCIDIGLHNKILPSILASQAILISNYGMDVHTMFSRNLYHLVVNDTWDGLCYSKDDQETFSNKESARKNSKVVAPILYRVYDNFHDSIEDYTQFLLTERRSPNGPIKYNKSLTSIKDYKEFINVLVRNGYMENVLHMNKDEIYINDWIYLIDELRLDEWDKEILGEIERMSSRSKRRAMRSYNKEVDIASVKEIENSNKKVFNDDDPIYRVRKSWEDLSSQLIATQDIDVAMSEATKHAGFKIYVGENGELFNDPWENIQENTNKEPDSPIKKVNVIQSRMAVTFPNKVPVYNSYIAENPKFYISGTVFYYDNIVRNNRVKITKTNNFDKNKNIVLGYIDLEDIFS